MRCSRPAQRSHNTQRGPPSGNSSQAEPENNWYCATWARFAVQCREVKGPAEEFAGGLGCEARPAVRMAYARDCLLLLFGRAILARELMELVRDASDSGE